MPTIHISDVLHDYLEANVRPFVETTPNAVLHRWLGLGSRRDLAFYVAASGRDTYSRETNT